ncbi:hypothetical protein BOX15_Mlig027272g2 [Macrostomum lignano]|uniref:Uncharacterized protein n=3 Tax=Macrostomum lignano TaxID=282301 RepID=A0A267FPA6_9PLAT|nr:hypothetical protein BOX15_Mlig005830g1 [Macrostomum lignano]PAA52233.1 hypothetical protein BOX15_Mlig027272g1 [Macrostomum lignano]PAA75650.1 hypothetical protein BOX15_Mlig027272g2 [Macrostomum lignano]
MIHSIFLINNSGDIFLEKHYKSVIPKTVCDYFFDEVAKASSPENVQPVIQTPNHIIISVYRAQIHFVAVCRSEVPPLFVIEFLHRVADIVKDYFEDVTETIIKDNVVLVYELLDEMLDNGFPLATEPNILKELIRPPTLFRTITDAMSGKNTNVSASLPTGQLSNIPWRRIGVRYANNEAYFDVIEELDAIVDRSGNVVMSDVAGRIDCLIKLSGMPDLTLTFVNSRLLEDVSLHPCIRFRRFDNDRALSFIPPDGSFRLMSYRAGGGGGGHGQMIPLTLRHTIQFREAASRLEISLSPRPVSGKVVDEVAVQVTFPRSVTNVSLTPSVGKYTFDSASRTLTWNVGKLEPQKFPSIKGPIILQTGAPVPDCNPTILVNFSISGWTVSGLRVNRLDLMGEKYKPFKGVKYVTRAGKLEFRT